MGGRASRAGTTFTRFLRSDWEVCGSASGADEPREGWLALDVLGPVGAALRRGGQWSLDSPSWDFNSQDWLFRVCFDAPTNDLDHWVLGIGGLATISDVFVNGVLLFSSESMHLLHEVRLRDPLRPRENELLIRCRSLHEPLDQRRPRPKWRTPMVQHQQLRWFRTTLLGQTPGWSPHVSVVGPWRPVWLERRAHVDVSSLRLDARVLGHKGMLCAAVELAPVAGQSVSRVTCELWRGETRLRAELVQSPGQAWYVGTIDVDEVALWWPHTHGEPALYNASIAVAMDDGSCIVEIDVGSIGFRTIALQQVGGDFALTVNGVAVFCRGACWTPIDPVSLSSSADEMARAMCQLQMAGMNMLRVSGSMTYECDAFLDACDSHGILLWQDFMFANMDYPAGDNGWAAIVDTEIRQQLSRMQGRPSLAVLCGNSEVEQQAAMWGAAREHWNPALFEHRLRELCADYCPDVPYWPSSAHGGAFPFQPDTGTTSYYGVGAYKRPIEDAQLSGLRFATECLAFANVPDAETLSRMPGGSSPLPHHSVWKQRSPRDLGAGWDFDDVRDHYLERLFGTRASDLRSVDPRRYLTLSRVTTGEVMARTFAVWRRVGSSCRGALVWFLRDLWAGAGWGLLDDKGAPKACFRMLSRVLQPVFVCISDDGLNGLHVHVSHERAEALRGNLDVKAYRSGEIVIAQGTRALDLPPRGAERISVVDLLSGFMDLSYAYRFGPAEHDLVVATLRANDGTVLGQNFHWLNGWSLQRSADIGLEASATQLEDGSAEVTIRTRAAAIAVHFEIETHTVDDDYFHLAPGSQHRVRLLPRSAGKPLNGRVAAINAAVSVPIRTAQPPTGV
jgi:beta-mannosidase